VDGESSGGNQADTGRAARASDSAMQDESSIGRKRKQEEREDADEEICMGMATGEPPAREDGPL
jgi:hypothetical protein